MLQRLAHRAVIVGIPWDCFVAQHWDVNGILQGLAPWDPMKGTPWDCFGIQHLVMPWHSSKASSLGFHYWAFQKIALCIIIGEFMACCKG